EVGILIGPEGGFSPSEMAMILGAGFTPVSLGNTTLRSVTAALYAVGVLAQE
ncbi:MAG TPA: RsmE family RNA methyltransferase, partial [Deltaproteobacteria bacterium]|nr:RsmE family RNA methyltransferase [Deltaproteobacteria bacterium]